MRYSTPPGSLRMLRGKKLHTTSKQGSFTTKEKSEPYVKLEQTQNGGDWTLLFSALKNHCLSWFFKLSTCLQLRLYTLNYLLHHKTFLILNCCSTIVQLPGNKTLAKSSVDLSNKKKNGCQKSHWTFTLSTDLCTLRYGSLNSISIEK